MTEKVALDDATRRYLLACEDMNDAMAAHMQIIHEWQVEGLRWLGRNDRFFLLYWLLHREDAIHPWLYARCREVEQNTDGYLDLWAREHYKAVDVTEVVPTPTGWKAHGDLLPGDWVYGPDGAPTRVVATTPVFTDADCWRVTFDDGYSVTVSGDHLWTVERKTRRRDGAGGRLYREFVTLSTREIAGHDHSADSRLAVPVHSALLNVEHVLEIPPYTLGCWLGDGANANGTITCGDSAVFDEIQADGLLVSNGRPSKTITRTVYDLQPRLRQLGLLHNKHIPRDYLWSSEAQRRALLQGLMDTDGHCNDRGTATFVNKHRPLADGVFELCASLGLKPRWRELSYDHGAVYQVSFQAYKVDEPFRIPRKLARCKDGKRAARRFVRSVERVDTIPVSCIQVDRPDGLYLIGRHMATTHNSTIITYAGVIQEILRDPEITIGIFSHTKPNARKFLLQIKEEFESNDELREAYPDIIWSRPQREAPKWSEEKGIVVKRKSNPKEATLEAHGLVDGQPTGAHFNLLVYDDVVTLEAVSTPEQVKKTTAAWSLSDNLGARGANGKIRKWHIGTRYSFNDSYHTMMEMQAVKPRIYPATDNGELDGEPVFLTKEAWEDKKRQQVPSVLAAQMLQNPAAGNEAMFKKDWLQFIDIRPATLNVYVLCDPAGSRKKTSDFTAIAVLGIDAAFNYYLLDGYYDRMNLHDRWTAFRSLRRVWMRVPGVQSVTMGYERYGMQSDIEHFELEMKRDGDAFPIIELAWPREGGNSKYDRIQRLVPAFRNQKFFLAAVTSGETSNQRRVREAGQPFRVFTPTKRPDYNGNMYSLNKVLITEFLTYPYSVHDDFLDAVSRIFDVDAQAPVIVNERMLEPEVFEDGI